MNTHFFLDRMPRDLRLKNDNVDVWRASLHMDASSLSALREFLVEDERMKADRLRFKRVRENYVAARGSLRLILAAYLNKQPKNLEFQYGQHGKPSLADGLNRKGITFNMSHSHGMALYCVGLEREIGADIEKIRTDMSFEKIGKRFFSSLEYETLKQLPDDQLKNGFFNCWTRKEAYIKAKGEGLSSLISRFAVSLVPGEPAALLDHQLDAGEINRWSLIDLDVGPGYTAALAVEGKGVTVTRKEPWWEAGQGQ
jgi:4'-phosphopantetheinyl transferase